MRPTLPTTVVIPSAGRASLHALLASLACGSGPRPRRLIVVDDTPQRTVASDLSFPGLPPILVVRSGGRGPAYARNLGWRHARTEWVSFLDDDVVCEPDWFDRLADDLATVEGDVAGVQGTVDVPLPAHRRPTDWERGTAGLASAAWITADMTYRRAVLSRLGGFDERFPRAYREDSDLALRVRRAGYRLVRGTRRVRHPVRPAGFWASVRQQAGNADDALMRRLHGPDWRRAADAPRGRLRRHLAVTGAGLLAVGFALAGKPRLARAAVAAWLAATAEFAVARIAPGPATCDEIGRMLVTSAVIPPVASWYALGGWWRHRRAEPWRGLPDLVLFDRDGTLIRNVPYNGDPERVRPMPGARRALATLRAAGIRTGVITNQSGVARGLLTRSAVDAVNARVDDLLGPFDTWQTCPHGPDDGCDCRKPAPGLVKRACAQLGVDPHRCVVVGDIDADVRAAQAAGAVGILVPTPDTRAEEVAAAPRICRDLTTAARQIVEGAW
mgnify:CR=1 FL=1